MPTPRYFTIFTICYLTSLPLAQSWVKLTNIECTAKEPSFISIDHCHLKVLKRNVVSLHIFVRIHKFPLTRVKVNLELMRKYSGYKPFLYNLTADFCKFMKNPSRQPFLKFFVDILQQNSNINHTCPYNHHIIVENLVLADTMFRILPLPSGDYKFILHCQVEGIWAVTVNAYLSIKDLKLS